MTKRILDEKGKPIRKKRSARLAICKSDDGEEWFVIPPADVPDWLKVDDVMADMVAGVIVSIEDSGPYYCAERIH